MYECTLVCQFPTRFTWYCVVRRAPQAILGRSCEPVVLIGPKPLRQVLVSLGRLEALSYTWVDGINLVPPHKLPGPPPPPPPTPNFLSTRPGPGAFLPYPIWEIWGSTHQVAQEKGKG